MSDYSLGTPRVSWVRTVCLIIALTALLPQVLVSQQSVSGADEVRVSARPYSPPSSDALRVKTELVEVGVVVRDARGHPISGLKQSDFRVYADGKERPLAAFSVDTPPAAPPSPTNSPIKPTLSSGIKKSETSSDPAPVPAPGGQPRFVGIYFDDVNTQFGDLRHAQVAAGRFVREALAPGDRVGVFTTSDTATLDFTNDAPKLLGVIEKIHAHPRMFERGLVPCPRMTPHEAYVIANHLDGFLLDAKVKEAALCVGAAPPNAPPTGGSGYKELRPEVQSVQMQAEQTWEQARVTSQHTLDAIADAVGHIAKMPGSRLLLIASAGFLAGTLEWQRDEIVDHALRAGVVIDALDAKGLYSEAPVRPIDEPPTAIYLPVEVFRFEVTSLGTRLQTLTADMAYFAEATGGLFFHDNNDLNFGFQQLGVVPEVSYRLAFHPSDESDGKYHKLKVQVSAAGPHEVQARPGYFATKDSGAASGQNKIDRTVMENDTISDLTAAVTAQPGKSPGGQTILWVTAHADLKDIQFVQQGDRHAQKLTFVMALFDEQGRFVTAKQGWMELALKDLTYTRLLQEGINAKLSLPAPPGAYRLRVIVQDAIQGKVAASSQPVEIP